MHVIRRYLATIYRRLRRVWLYRLFLADYFTFKRMNRTESGRLPLRWEDARPCLDEKDPGHSFDHHYIYHPAWAARVLAQTKPNCHIDISSTLHFSTLISAFIPTTFYDYRAADVHLSNLHCMSADLLALPFDDESIESLSCMHVVEHIGLGRYGDHLDAAGDLKAISELKRVLATGGSLLFAAPVGRARVCFNAHRVYSYEQVLDCFDGLHLREFALICDDDQGGGLVMSASREMVDRQEYGCGCFWFVKQMPALEMSSSHASDRLLEARLK